MKKNIIYWAALAVIAAACSNEESLVTVPANNGTDEVKMITETISATNGDEATRADVDADAKFTWSTGDQIAVHVSDGKYYTTEALAAGGSKSAEFTVTYPDGQARDAYAVYPASIVSASAANYGQSGKALDVTLPGSYTLAQVSGTTTPCPMIATNATGSGWTFSQLCGLLRLTVNNIPANTSYLKIDFNGKKVQGVFSITSDVTPGTSTIATSATDGTDDIITITDLGISSWTDGMVLNLPLPTGNYTNVTVTAYNSSDKAILTITRPFNSSGTYTAARANGRKVTASMPVFSVSSTNRVSIAPGNLQYVPSTGVWSFHENQYDVCEDFGNWGESSRYTSTGTQPIDLFGWGTSGWPGTSGAVYGPNYIPYSTDLWDNYGPYPVSHDLTDDYANGDWGVYNAITDGSITYPAGTWRTLSKDEWSYLLNPANRPVSNAYTLATIAGSYKGMIIFPDNYTQPTGDGYTAGTYNTSSNFTTTVTSDYWIKMEQVGCVFLPLAGFREGIEINGGSANYWSVSTAVSGNAYKMGFQKSLVAVEYTSRYYGCSVRLVRDIK